MKTGLVLLALMTFAAPSEALARGTSSFDKAPPSKSNINSGQQRKDADKDYPAGKNSALVNAKSSNAEKKDSSSKQHICIGNSCKCGSSGSR